MGSPDGAPIIVGEAVYKTYDTGRVKVDALRGIDVRVDRGEMVAVMGPSGCGKTTLLNCLSGLDEIDSGVITIAGTDLAGMSDNDKTRYRARKMGYIFQSYNLLPVLTAVENVELPLLVSGTRPSEARAMAGSALEMVGLTEWDDHYPSELSGGQAGHVPSSGVRVRHPVDRGLCHCLR